MDMKANDLSGIRMKFFTRFKRLEKRLISEKARRGAWHIGYHSDSMETFSSKTYWQVRVVAVQGGRQE
jgi:hypothetical protein